MSKIDKKLKDLTVSDLKKAYNKYLLWVLGSFIVVVIIVVIAVLVI